VSVFALRKCTDNPRKQVIGSLGSGQADAIAIPLQSA
jgi:hypothetical protein